MATHLTVHKAPGLGDYQTIQAAITASSSGTVEDRSTVTILDAGTYNESLTIGHDCLDIIAAADCTLTATTGYPVFFTAAGTVRFLTENGAQPTIAPNTASRHIFNLSSKVVHLTATWRVRVDSGTGWRLTHCENGSGGHSQILSGVVALPGAGTWRNGAVINAGHAGLLSITDCNFDVIPSLSPSIGSATQLIVERSRIRTSSVATGTAGAAPASRIINNIITHHQPTSSGSYLIAGPALPAAGALVAHNMLIGSGLVGGATIAPAHSTTQFINNVVVNFHAAGTLGGTGPTARNNCLFQCANGFDLGWDVEGTITADPLITTDIDPDSPCIGAGMDLPAVTDDILGRPRPQGAGWDIGPYELPHTDPPDPPPPPEPFRGQIATPAALDVDAAGTSYADPPWTWLVDDPNDLTALVDSALIWSIGTDSALPRGKLPQPDGTPTPYRGGHWADPLISGLPGSLLWTLRRADWTETTQREGVRAITAALTWLVDAGIIEGVEVSAQPDPGVWLVSYICVITGDRRSRRVE